MVGELLYTAFFDISVVATKDFLHRALKADPLFVTQVGYDAKATFFCIVQARKICYRRMLLFYLLFAVGIYC